MPEKKEHNEDVLYDYYWTINITRRRRKLSIGQLAKSIGESEEIIRSIEKGKIPQNFEEIFRTLKSFAFIGLC